MKPKINEFVSRFKTDKKLLIIVVIGIVGVLLLVLSELLPEKKTDEVDDNTLRISSNTDDFILQVIVLESNAIEPIFLPVQLSIISLCDEFKLNTQSILLSFVVRLLHSFVLEAKLLFVVFS